MISEIIALHWHQYLGSGLVTSAVLIFFAWMADRANLNFKTILGISIFCVVVPWLVWILVIKGIFKHGNKSKT